MLLLFLYSSEQAISLIYFDEAVQPTEPVGGIVRCLPGKYNHCYDFVYCPNTDPKMNSIVEFIASHNPGRALSIATSSGDTSADILGFPSYAEMREYVLEHNNITLAGLRLVSEAEYNGMDEEVLTTNSFIYQVWHNEVR